MISSAPLGTTATGTAGLQAAGLAAALRAECEAYAGLGALLTEEHTALVEVQVERLESIGAEKARLYDRLRALARRRTELLAADGVVSTPGAMRAWAARHPGEVPAALEEWRRLLPMVRKTRQQNRLNGRLAGALTQHFRSRLNVLMESAGYSATYGRDGSTQIIRFPGPSIARV